MPAEAWGGLPLSLLLTAGGLAGALPLALLIAYGRRHAPPALAGLLRLAVDLAGSLPLVAVLFAASFLLPCSSRKVPHRACCYGCKWPSSCSPPPT